MPSPPPSARRTCSAPIPSRRPSTPSGWRRMRSPTSVLDRVQFHERAPPSLQRGSRRAGPRLSGGRAGDLDGRVHVGVTDAELERIAKGAVKVSARDLGWALARDVVGATTVAATMRAAVMAGVRFFATGGIGGVHRGRPEDESSDLIELSRTPVAVFCAGAKIILDLRLTLERLESLAVPVLGYGCDEFPAFYSRRSGCPVSARVDGESSTARVLRAVWDTGGRGVVVAVPPPTDLEGAEEMARLAVGELRDVRGGSVTPRLLARMAELSGGRSLDLNVDLVVNNARVAAQVARAYF